MLGLRRDQFSHSKTVFERTEHTPTVQGDCGFGNNPKDVVCIINFGWTEKINNGSNNFTDSAFPLYGYLPSPYPWNSRITISRRYHFNTERVLNGSRYHSITSCPLNHLSDPFNDRFLTLLDWEKVWQKSGRIQNISSDHLTQQTSKALEEISKTGHLGRLLRKALVRGQGSDISRSRSDENASAKISFGRRSLSTDHHSSYDWNRLFRWFSNPNIKEGSGKNEPHDYVFCCSNLLGVVSFQIFSKEKNQTQLKEKENLPRCSFANRSRMMVSGLATGNSCQPIPRKILH